MSWDARSLTAARVARGGRGRRLQSKARRAGPSGLSGAKRARPGFGGRRGTRSARERLWRTGRKIPGGRAWGGGDLRDTLRAEEGEGTTTESERASGEDARVPALRGSVHTHSCPLPGLRGLLASLPSAPSHHPVPSVAVMGPSQGRGVRIYSLLRPPQVLCGHSAGLFSLSSQLREAGYRVRI